MYKIARYIKDNFFFLISFFFRSNIFFFSNVRRVHISKKCTYIYRDQKISGNRSILGTVSTRSPFSHCEVQSATWWIIFVSFIIIYRRVPFVYFSTLAQSEWELASKQMWEAKKKSSHIHSSLEIYSKHVNFHFTLWKKNCK